MSSPFLLHAPAEQTTPVVFASAHSGCAYPAEFVAAARLDALALRRSEDSFVDELFGAAPALGAPLLAATFPRAFCDANREAWELDPAMFDDLVPAWINSASSRVHAGLGMIARVVADGQTIYRGKLPFAEAERRVREYWEPFHAALAGLVARTRERFGCCLLVDCHSMPGGDANRADMVLGDAHGTSCGAAVIEALEAALRARKYRMGRNDPYAGGYITRHYGMPSAGVHAVQIEVARRLYMDERLIRKSAGFAALREDISAVIGGIAAGAGWWMADSRQGEGAALDPPGPQGPGPHFG